MDESHEVRRYLTFSQSPVKALQFQTRRFECVCTVFKVPRSQRASTRVNAH